MTKMTGIIFMAIGTILLIIGIVVFNTSKLKKVEPTLQQPLMAEEVRVLIDTVLTEKNTANNEKTVETELQNITAMAIADGVLTANEKEKIRKFAFEKSMDYDTMIAEVEENLKQTNIEAETELIDKQKKKGDDFEKFIVGKFNKKYFKLLEWAGDKYDNGMYAETTLNPDLVLQFSHKSISKTFAVECKWRKDSYKGGIEFTYNEQLVRYRKYEKEKQMPVFIAIGRGGEPSSPKYLSVIPLKIIESTFIPLDMLKKYNKNQDKDFFYDFETEQLD